MFRSYYKSKWRMDVLSASARDRRQGDARLYVHNGLVLASFCAIEKYSKQTHCERNCREPRYRVPLGSKVVEHGQSINSGQLIDNNTQRNVAKTRKQ